jgi:hypothetical protein
MPILLAYTPRKSSLALFVILANVGQRPSQQMVEGLEQAYYQSLMALLDFWRVALL